MRRRWNQRMQTLVGMLIVFACFAESVSALTRYKVGLNTAALSGEQAKLAYDFVSGGVVPGTLEIQNFTHNGTTAPLVGPGMATFEGGPVRGALLIGANPAPLTLVGNEFFYNQLTVPFQALGSSVTFAVQLPEPSPAPVGIPDEMSFFYLRGDGLTTLDTADPLGADALFSIDLTGAAGGDLSVFSPMTFIAPDSIVLQLSSVSVPSVDRPIGRLKFLGIIPNPSSREVRISYEVPQPGGLLRIKVFDIAGRLIAEPFVGKRLGGSWMSTWDTRTLGGGRVAAGVYLVQLELGGQTLVRKVVLAR